jgi:hypothetical protein
MTILLEVVLAIIVALVLAVAALRVRKLRRDEMRESAAHVDRRLMAPPPSPYTPSKGFRLLDGPVSAPVRPEPSRPRLEPDRDYVFSESQLPDYVKSVSPLGRHDELWALSKSARRTRVSVLGLRVVVILLVVIALVGIVGYYVTRNDHHAGTTTTTTTTTTTLASSAAQHRPTSLSASPVGGQSVSYVAAMQGYRVSVSGAQGAVHEAIGTGSASTLV